MSTSHQPSGSDNLGWRGLLVPLAPALLVYLALIGIAVFRGLHVISVDDLMRHLLSTRLFSTNAPETANIGDDLYYWPWGHLIMVRLAIETLGHYLPEVGSIVLFHVMAGFAAVCASGWLARLLGSSDKGVAVAAFLFATMNYTPLLGISILSDLPCALFVMLGFGLHLRAFRREGAITHRMLLPGDFAYAIAASMRYEAWPLAMVVGLASTWAHLRRTGDRFPVFASQTMVRGLVYSAFPIFWLLLNTARFDGNPFFFREIAASRIDGQRGFMEELGFNSLVFWLTAPAAWVMLISAALWRAIQKPAIPAPPALVPRFMGLPLLIGLAILWAVFQLASALSIGRASNLPDRLMYTPAALLVPLAGCLVGHWFRGGTTWLRRGLVLGLLMVSLAIPLHEVLTRSPFRRSMPIHLAETLEATRKRLAYDKDDAVRFTVDWNKYPAMFPIWIAGRHYDFEWTGYTPELRRKLNIWHIDPEKTRFFITDNDRLVRDAILRYPWVAVYKEDDVWFFLDLRGNNDIELESMMTASPRVKYLRSGSTRPKTLPKPGPAKADTDTTTTLPKLAVGTSNAATTRPASLPPPPPEAPR